MGYSWTEIVLSESYGPEARRRVACNMMAGKRKPGFKKRKPVIHLSPSSDSHLYVPEHFTKIFGRFQECPTIFSQPMLIRFPVWHVS